MAQHRGLKWGVRAVMGGVLGAAWLLAGCGQSDSGRVEGSGGDEGPRVVASEKESSDRENAPPRIVDLTLEPRRPLPGQRMRAVLRAEDPDGDRLTLHTRWWLDGELVAEDQETVELLRASKGETLMVEAWASDGIARSPRRRIEARVANRPPELWAVAIEGDDEVEPGSRIVASPRGHDPDGDELSFEYRWRVNGERQRVEGPLFETEGLRRGDEVEVAVVASDGESRSEEKASAIVAVGNRSPRIVSDARWTEREGVFRYQVKADDPDGDRNLRYRLLEAPPGMQIDPVLGEVTWDAGPEHEGTHDVAIEVDDLHGGRGVQRVELTIRLDDTPEDESVDSPGPASYGAP